MAAQTPRPSGSQRKVRNFKNLVRRQSSASNIRLSSTLPIDKKEKEKERRRLQRQLRELDANIEKENNADAEGRCHCVFLSASHLTDDALLDGDGSDHSVESEEEQIDAVVGFSTSVSVAACTIFSFITDNRDVH